MKRLVPVLALAVCLGIAWSPPAAAQVVQTPLKTSKIPQFVDPLPVLFNGLPVVLGPGHTVLSICEFETAILPAGTLGKNTPAPLTKVWGYQVGATCNPNPGHSYIGPVVVAQRGTAKELTFINQLGYSWDSQVLAYTQNTDQTMHWADPVNGETNACAHQADLGYLPTGLCLNTYDGPIAAAVHLHGGEVPPQLDGGPDSWFTGGLAPGDPSLRGHGYYTREVLTEPMGPAGSSWGSLVRWDSNPDPDIYDYQYYLNDGGTWTQTPTVDRATFVYPNLQEAANIWFHDHILGMTRLNVYAGIAGAYVITDPDGVNIDLQNAAELIPLVIQDRTFDTNGQLWFGNGGATPEHPYWIPEFIGDVIVVNGKSWPYLNVEQAKYRFLFLNGSNARTYDVRLKDITNDLPGPSMWVIGNDGGFLDAPALIDNNAMPPQTLVVMPGERYEVVIDFSNVPVGTALRMENKAGTPFPFGEKVNGSTTKRVMEFRVVANGGAPDVTPTAYDPAAYDPLVPTTSPRKQPIVALGGITPVVRRQLTLNEVDGLLAPREALLNNTKWHGKQIVEGGGTTDPNLVGTRVQDDFTLVDYNGVPTYYSELPAEGTTEVWEIINITADAHPVHLHLVQFQVVERQALDSAACYFPLYASLFTGPVPGTYMPGYGPPLNYNTPNLAGALGGNPDPGAAGCLVGLPIPPDPSEAGWKDTVISYPDQVLRLLVRWAPTDTPAGEVHGYPFVPDEGHGYVWHCHILDHEDNEMMRPTKVISGSFGRSFEKGTDY